MMHSTDMKYAGHHRIDYLCLDQESPNLPVLIGSIPIPTVEYKTDPINRFGLLFFCNVNLGANPPLNINLG